MAIRSRRLSLPVVAGAAMSLAFAPIAAADPPALPEPGSEDAASTISDLKDQGYSVQLNWVNGSPNASMDQCSVDDINTVEGNVAYVAVDCPK